MRRSLAIFGLGAFAAAAALTPMLFSGAARSQATIADGTFMIAANDGYGIADCLTGGAACGQIIADAYCEAHGFARATTFGPAADTTASISRAAASEPPPIAINCRK